MKKFVRIKVKYVNKNTTMNIITVDLKSFILFFLLYYFNRAIYMYSY